jgi:hypothetical protein
VVLTNIYSVFVQVAMIFGVILYMIAGVYDGLPGSHTRDIFVARCPAFHD